MGDVICDLISWQKVKEKVNPSGWRLKVSDVNRIWRDSWAITKPADDSLAEFKINTKTDVDVIITEHIFVSSKKGQRKSQHSSFYFVNVLKSILDIFFVSMTCVCFYARRCSLQLPLSIPITSNLSVERQRIFTDCEHVSPMPQIIDSCSFRGLVRCHMTRICRIENYAR